MELTDKIDYKKLKDFQLKKNITRGVAGAKHIQNVLSTAEIYSPLDLLKEISFEIKYAKEGSCDSFNTKNLDGKELYLSFLKRYKTFGEKSINLLLDYLDSQGFNFNKEYAEKLEEIVN